MGQQQVSQTIVFFVSELANPMPLIGYFLVHSPFLDLPIDGFYEVSDFGHCIFSLPQRIVTNGTIKVFDKYSF